MSLVPFWPVPARPARQWMLRTCAAAGLLAAALGLAAPGLSAYNAFWDLCSDLRVTWLGMTVFAAFGLVLLAAWLEAGGVLLLACLQALPLAAWSIAPTTPGGSAPRALPSPLRVLSLNVHWDHRNLDEVIALVRSRRPDVFVAQELTGVWIEGLAQLEDEYRYREVHPRFQEWGLGVYARRPFERVPVADGELRTHTLPVDLPDACVRLIAVHTYRTKPMQMEGRNRQLRKLASLVRAHDGPLVLAGDFNVSPFSAHYRRFVRDARVGDARRGFGLASTFPLPGPLPGAILDHVFVKGGVDVVRFEVGPDAGSDHRPLWVELTVPPCPPAAPADGRASRR